MESHDFRMVPVYRGRVKACIFDWAGTVCDSGVFAPVITFQSLFREEGVELTDQEVRAPMGVHKKVHITKLCEMPSVRERWYQKHGRYPTSSDIERIYVKSLEATLTHLPAHSKMIAGVVDTIQTLRTQYAIKIGSSTGYTSEIMAGLKEQAAAEGYVPDSYVTSDEVLTGRPSPAMILLNMVRLDVYPAQAVVKVDDTEGGIEAGLHAGCWTVGVAKTGNYVGMTEAELEAADPQLLASKMEEAKSILYKAGAHFVIDTVNHLPAVIEDINRRLALGLRP